MAEYFPLLERAVSGLQDATPESRRAIYDRARNALLGQLRAMQPPVPEADIERESQALDEAIGRLEERFGKEKPRAAPAAPAPARPAVGVRPPASRPQPAATPPGLPVGKAPPVAPPPLGERPTPAARAPGSAASSHVSPPPRPRPAIGPTGAEATPPRPSLAARPSGAAARTAPSARPAAERAPRPVPDTSTNDGAAATGGTAESSSGPIPKGAPRLDISATDAAGALATAPVLPSAPRLDVQNEAEAAEAADPPEADAIPSSDPRRDGGAVSGGRPKPARSAAARPAAPRPAEAEPRGIGFYVVACVVFVLVVGIAVAAWRLRDRPEQVTAAQTATSAPEAPGKIVDRVGGDAASPPPQAAATGDTATTPAPVPQGSGQPTAPATPDASAAPASAPAETAAAPLPVSQRAALLVDAPEDPQKVKTYVGSVVWRTESVSPGQGQPLSNAVRADVDIPDAKLTMSMVLKKNLEPQFPASHTMEFHFTEMPGNTLGPVKQINVPEMRKDDSAPTGDPLTGVPVSITDDYFLVGLSRGAAESTNLQLLSDRNWIDVSILLKSGKVAKITFEKGTTGQRILEDALKSWQ